MSRVSLWILGIFGLLCAVGFGALTATRPADPSHPYAPVMGWTLTGVCVAMSAACLLPRSRPVTARFIGGVVFAACCAHVYTQLTLPQGAGPPAEPTLDRALLAFFLFGLPAGYALVTGKYPIWGEWGGALSSDQQTPPEDA